VRKLVELDPVTMTTKEVDGQKIRQSALALKEYLLKLTAAEDQYGIKSQVLPIVEAALQQSLNLPFDGRKTPLGYEGSEGLLPAEYRKLAAPFFVAITGMSGLGHELLKPIHKDGKLFVWMEFEEP
jgi:hypothetical protein